MTAVFKKGFKGSKGNYRPVSVLPIISLNRKSLPKIFEKIISKQITNFMDPLLSKSNMGFEEVLVQLSFGNVRKIEIIGG